MGGLPDSGSQVLYRLRSNAIRVNFIDTRDVADVARVALLEEFGSAPII